MDPFAQHIEESILNLRSPDQEVRKSAAKALYELGEAARPAIPALIDALLTEQGACPWIGEAIFEIGADTSNVDSLRKGLRHLNDHVRFWAARALVTCGPAAEPAIPDLICALKGDPSPVGDSACWALSVIGEPAVTALNQAAAGDDPTLREVAAHAVRVIHDCQERRQR